MLYRLLCSTVQGALMMCADTKRLDSKQSADTPKWGVIDRRRAIDAAGVALWSWNVDTDRLTMDERGFALWNVGAQGDITFEDLSGKIHPADRDRVSTAFSATRAAAVRTARRRVGPTTIADQRHPLPRPH